IHKDGDGDALFQLKSDSLPHAHAQTTKTYYKHRPVRNDKRHIRPHALLLNAFISGIHKRWRGFGDAIIPA
ncbi:hypothetical protein Tco_1447918, partial [Tanacetum coccineum]